MLFFACWQDQLPGNQLKLLEVIGQEITQHTSRYNLAYCCYFVQMKQMRHNVSFRGSG